MILKRIVKYNVGIFIAQVINSFVNNSYLILGLIFCNPQILGKMFVFNSLYTLIVGIIRFAYGSKEFTSQAKKNHDLNFYLRLSTILFLLVIVIHYMLDQVLRIKSDYGYLLLLGSTCGLIYEFMRIDFISLGSIRHLIFSDISMVVTNAGLAIITIQKKDAQFASLIDAWGISNFVALIIALFQSRSRFEKSNRFVLQKKQKVVSLIVIPIITSGVNFLINDIWSIFGNSEIIGFGRGFTLFFLPVNFIIGLFPIFYLKKQDLLVPIKFIPLTISSLIAVGGIAGFVYYSAQKVAFQILISFVLIIFDYILIAKNSKKMYFLIGSNKIKQVMYVRGLWGILYISLSWLLVSRKSNTFDFALITLISEVFISFAYSFLYKTLRISKVFQSKFFE